jgi:hypothetical protein
MMEKLAKALIKKAVQGSITAAITADVLSGEAWNWSRADWRAVPKLILHDVERFVATVILDHTSFGRALTSEVLLRRSFDRAKASGADVFCVYHDCDIHRCSTLH